MLRVLEHPLIPAILTYIVPLLAIRVALCLTGSILPMQSQHPRPKISSYPSVLAKFNHHSAHPGQNYVNERVSGQGE